MQSFKQPPACFNITESAAWPPFGNNPSRSIRPDLPLYGLMFKAKRSIRAFLRKELFCLMKKYIKEKHPRAEARGCGCLMGGVNRLLAANWPAISELALVATADDLIQLRD